MNGIILGLISGVLFGVFFSSLDLISRPFSFLILCLSIGLSLFFLKRNFKSVFSIGACFLIGVSLGSLRFFSQEDLFMESKLFVFQNKEVEVLGIVFSEPVFGEKTAKIYLNPKSINSEQFLSKEKILIHFNPLLPVSYGDVVNVKGKLTKIENFDESFDYVSYQKKEDSQFQIQFASIEKIGASEGNTFLKLLFNFKDKLQKNIQKFLTEPNASLVSGMVISGKNSLPEEVKNDFIRVGLIHIVVLSGYNIALVISFVSLMFKKFSLRVRVISSAIFVIIFVLIAGASAPIIRSAVMAYISLSGKLFFRKVKQNRTLLFSATVMVFINPYILVSDPSFALTFLATFAIINISPIIFEKIDFVPEKFSLREILSQTLAVEVLVVPFLLYKMGTVSLIAPISNILALPIIPYITFLGILLATLGFLGFILYPIAILLQLLVSWIFLVSRLGDLPFAFIEFSSFPLWLCLAIYILILFVFFVKKVNLPLKFKGVE